MRFFEDMKIGQRREVGSFTFTADAIKKFAAQFDPQRFHLDEEAGPQVAVRRAWRRRAGMSGRSA